MPASQCVAPSIVVRTAAVIFRGEFILLHRRRGEAIWALPGGTVELGESSQSAVVRELREELGEQLHVQRLVFLVENGFAHQGQQHHELGLYYLGSFEERAAVNFKTDAFAGYEPAADLEFRWFSQQELGGLDLRPSFLTSALANTPLEFRHVVVGLAGTEV